MKWRLFITLCVLSVLFCALVYNSSNLKDWNRYQPDTERPNSSADADFAMVQSNVTESNMTTKNTEMPKCPDTPPELVGPLRIVFDEEFSLEKIAELNPYVEFGGHHRPKECNALQHIAIIIPFRNRDHHLTHWLYYLHPILRRQQGDYGIYIIEQAGKDTFNRAKLLNVGFVEALKDVPYDCFIFSDVDIIPLDDRNLYRCSSQPRHLASAMDKFNFRLPYEGYFGGIVAFTKEQYLKINGFSNSYWGWGTEDDDTYKRVVMSGMKVERPERIIGRTKMIKHERDKGNEVNTKNYDIYNRMKFTKHLDGYQSLKYRLLKVEKMHLYTKVTVDIGKPPS
ncbi:beta-1,4-galactosyltransferase 2 isoform X2 [Callorhinchus milii]|uniref:Beta-1,4-galactosyltransferase n=1 Tax=Callorhinchus milii TaxID=7868 RepID=A0A4W3GXF1_CALMI|nr:beta-1,4-galactosyltransferase 2 isoform X2 [Callorhinchus milii]